MRTQAKDWPKVPAKMAPKALYVAENLPDQELTTLKELGWEVQDVRLLSGASVAERQTRCLAWFDGLMAGSIDKGAANFAVLELEAKACGLTGLKELPKDEEKGLEDETVDEILGGLKSRRTGMRLKV